MAERTNNGPITDRVATAAGTVAILVGTAALVGWVLDIVSLKSLLPGIATMKVNTAAAMVLLGVALTLQIRPHSFVGKIAIGRGCAMLAVTAGLLTLFEYTFGVDLGFDQVLFHPSVQEAGIPFPSRMAPNTAISLTFLGTALLLLDSPNRVFRKISEILSCLTLFSSFIAIVGYVMNVRSLYGVPGFSSMAIHSAAGCAALSIGILAARPERGCVAIVTQDNAAGAAARRTLPLTIACLMVIAWLRLQGQYAGFYGTEFGLALIVSTFTAAFTSIVLWNASTQGRAEEQIAAVQQRMNALVESAHDAIMTKDLNGVVRSWNPAAEQMLGYRAADIIGKSVTLLIPTERLDEEVAILAQIARGQKIAHFETVRCRRDGSLIEVELTISPIMDSTGAVIGASKIMRDIAERKRASEQFRLALEAAPTGMLMTDGKGTIVLINEQIETLFGYERDELLGQPVELLLPERFRVQRSGADSFSADLNNRPTGAARELCGLRKDGTEVPIEIALNPLHTPEGDFVLSSMVDISGRKRADEVHQQMLELRLNEQLLRDASSVADKANKAKSEFLANMSHEIRTPLNAVIGLGYLLEQTPLSEEQRQFLVKIRFASRGLLNVVDNVLDLSKIEAGEMLLEAERFDLLELIRDLSLMLAPQATAKGIELVLRPAADLPRWVAGDAMRLRQVLTNLVANSIKFTEAGQVELRVFRTDTDLDRIQLRCEVEDTGIGIESAALAQLFTPFTQADTSTTRRFGGTGLGLSIARRFVELMGGKIGVSSIVSEGTTFWFEVPLRLALDAADQGRTDTSQGLRILIADLAGASPQGLGRMIRALGWTPKVVETVDQLIGALHDAPPTLWPDVLIFEAPSGDCDIRDLIAGLEKDCSHSELPPVLVIADMAHLAMMNKRGLRAIDALLARPVTSSALFNAINSAVWKRDGSQVRRSQSNHLEEGLHTQSLVGVRALVVDDSEINVEVAKRILEKQGAIVTTCSDGSAAIEAVRVQHLQLDIVLMDVQMPIIDGNEAARRIRNELGIKSLPIMALTAGALMAERQRSIEAGMNEFITKPFEPLILIGKVRRLVEQARGTSIPQVTLDRKPAAARTNGSPVASIDAATVQRMFGDDLSLFNSLLGRMLREFGDLALPVSIHDQSSRDELRARAHKLKGSAGMIGATRVMSLASVAEKALQQGRSTGVVERILRQLAAALTTLGEEARPLLEKEIELTGSAGPAGAADAPNDIAVKIRELHTSLENQDLAALDRFRNLSPSLSGLLGKMRFDDLRVAVEDLNFSRAALLLGGATSGNEATRAEGRNQPIEGATG